MAPEDRRRNPPFGGLPWLVAVLGVLALGAVWFLWPLLRAVAILAVDAVLFALLGAVAYFYLRRLRRRRKHAAEEEALAAEREAPPAEQEPPSPAERLEELPPPKEESLPSPVPEQDRDAEVEAKLQAIKRRLGKE
jgi:flagellar biosynthesis/type III secretory pathway M-ring protein FliF/YscJ